MKKEIEQIVTELDLISVSENYFWKAYRSYKEEEAEEHNTKIGESDISILLKIIAYKLLLQSNSEIIEIKFDILLNRLVIGDYSLIMDYNTKNFVDDYFVLY